MPNASPFRVRFAIAAIFSVAALGFWISPVNAQPGRIGVPHPTGTMHHPGNTHPSGAMHPPTNPHPNNNRPPVVVYVPVRPPVTTPIKPTTPTPAPTPAPTPTPTTPTEQTTSPTIESTLPINTDQPSTPEPSEPRPTPPAVATPTPAASPASDSSASSSDSQPSGRSKKIKLIGIVCGSILLIGALAALGVVVMNANAAKPTKKAKAKRKRMVKDA
jgi:hypothetical protein